MNFSLIQISQIIHASYNSISQTTNINWRLEIDSRHIHYPEQTIFVALPGTHHHGIQFIPDLIKKGVKVFIIDQDIPYEDNVTYLKVDKCLTAIQELAIAHRNKFIIPCIGITGSNGKTIIKEWLSQIVQQNYSVCKNPKSYNSQLGVALSVLQLLDNHEIGIFEAGISQMNEMNQLREMIQPSIGILSNLGDAHDSGFEDRKAKLKEKIELFKNCKYFYYPGNDNWLHENLKHDTNARSWGVSENNNSKIILGNANSNGLVVKIIHNQNSYDFHLPFSDSASIENFIPCILCSLDLGLSQESIQSGFSQLQSFRMRLEHKEGINNCLLINDSYSLDINSLLISFQQADQYNKTLERVLFITDFPDSKNENENHNRLIQLINKYKFTRIIGVGSSIRSISTQLDRNTKFHSYSTTEELLNNLDQLQIKNNLILIKGARIFRLERVFEELSLSNHESILEINLKSIAHNISVYKSFLNPSTQIIAVVKASAYGSGQYEVARYLEHLGVHMLAVAYQDEAIHLRNKGIQCPIMVMNSGLSDFEKLSENNIDSVIFSLPQLQRMIQEVSHNTEHRIHIKLDTGMNRLGFKSSDLVELIQVLLDNQYLKVISIFSHLSGSDSSDYFDFTQQQYSSFTEAYKQISKSLLYDPKAHILNSGGISIHPTMQLDIVRLGIGMYGIDNNPKIIPQLEKAHRLKTKITQIKKVSSSDKISYSLSGQLNSDGRIAVLSIGYADGLPRSAGIKNYQVNIKGIKCKIIGAVCMDMCMIDVSHIQDVQVGDEVEIFGLHSSIEELSHVTGRIPYEILCGISARVKRVFVEE
ncbi:MAG: bifunctional UDP-N-acetylmuramoyl-tripeptide:D-alanyl-D-alanine ligase/alanine racemase [Saprospiraceae bacterium]|nr:bifunctional UDP-N-acetylmuramoyl-tripeptide:D-alanyl-D-alanine ligase/alanine racemase [Saprospiraceae bacterium]